MQQSAHTNSAREEFAAYLEDETSIEAVKPLAQEYGWSADRIHTGGIASAVRALSAMTSPQFLLVDLSESDNPKADINALADVCEPGTIVLALGTTNDVTLYRDLLNSGVHDYILKPAHTEVLRDSFASAIAVMNDADSEEDEEKKQTGHRLAGIIGIRGGTGASTITTALAHVLSNNLQRKTALLDMDLHFGTSALNFDLEPGRGLLDALENPGRVDTLFIERAMIKESDRLSILGAETPLSDALQIDPGALSHLVNEVRNGFECVVADMPRFVATQNSYILNDFNDLVIVSDLSLVATRDTIRLLSLLDEVAPDARRHIIINRTSKGTEEVALKDFEASIEQSVVIDLPFDGRVAAEASKKGRPVTAIAPNCKFSKGITELASRLAVVKAGENKKTKWPALKLIKKAS